MGVQRELSLSSAQKLFENFTINSLETTKDGVMDTTYLSDLYVFKYYEREIEIKIQEDALRLLTFRKNMLPTPELLGSSQGWYLYSRLKGSLAQSRRLYHIQALARFIATMHSLSKTLPSSSPFLANYPLPELLKKLKKNHYFYYKKFSDLKTFHMKEDGFIHGDIFKDNTLFEGEHVRVFDFIDGGRGSFVFDLAVTLVSFNPHKRESYTNIFLNTYNQRAPQKIELKELQKHITLAAKLYALLRIYKYKNTKKAQELANLW